MATSVAKRTPLGAQPRCRMMASCGDSEKCLKLTACGGAARVRHRSIHRDRPALPPREADRSGAGECRRLACSLLSPKLARGKVRQGAKALRNGSSAITRQSSELAAESGGVDRVRPRVADRPRYAEELKTWRVHGVQPLATVRCPDHRRGRSDI